MRTQHILAIDDSKISSTGRCSCGAVWVVPLGPGCWVRLHELHRRHLQMVKPVQDELTRAIAKARKGNPVDAQRKLMAEESKWKRRRTIADNKLAEVRARINEFAMELAAEAVKTPLAGKGEVS